MKWRVHGKKAVYKSSWVELWLDEVETPDGERFDHHVLRFPRPSTTAVVVKDDQVLLLWRHRFITDAWGWEVPAGWADPGEETPDAIAREVEEETGWRPKNLSKLLSYNALSGISSMRFHAYLATDAEHIGPPTDTNEAERIAWLPVSDVPRLMASGEISDGPTITALSYYLASRNPQR